jgi:hypothetical protein
MASVARIGSVFLSLLGMTVSSVNAFAPQTSIYFSPTSLQAKPRRLEENVDGPLFVNDRVSYG